jgi:hypothetical protein
MRKAFEKAIRDHAHYHDIIDLTAYEVDGKFDGYRNSVTDDMFEAFKLAFLLNSQDTLRLNRLEELANQPGGILLHDGGETGRTGLGLRPGNLVRTLRQAIDDTMKA